MRFFIYSHNQPEVCQLIVDLLKKDGHDGKVYSNYDHLYEDFKFIHRKPDVIFMDYQSYNHEIFDINEYFFNDKKAVPYIFYNDPCPTSYSLTNHWVSQTISFFRQRKEETPYEYLELYADLEQIVISPEISRHISLLNKPIKFENKTLDLENILSDFKQQTNIPQSLCNLLTIFIKNKDKTLSTDELRRLLAKNDKEISEASVKVMISNLRKYLNDYNKVNLVISKKDNEYKLIEVI